MRGRITRIFVRAMPGREPEVRAGLERLAAGRLNVEPANFDVTLFKVAAAPANQGESLFSGISALVGFLFAFNAMLLTLPLRQGLDRRVALQRRDALDIVEALLFDALVLGGLAAVLGPGARRPALDRRVSLEPRLSVVCVPGRLAAGRDLAEHRDRHGRGAGGRLYRRADPAPGDLLSPPARTAASGGRHIRRWSAIGALSGGIACLAVTTAILLAAPQSAVLGSVILVIALLLLLPLLLDAVVAVFDRLQAHFGSAATRIAVIELRSPKTRARSLAIAATGAIAVFGSVAIQGAQANLQRGLDRLVHQLSAVPPTCGSRRRARRTCSATTPFRDNDAPQRSRVFPVCVPSACIARLSRLWRSRIWVLAPPCIRRTSDSPEPTGHRRPRRSRRRGCAWAGWAVLSQAVADATSSASRAVFYAALAASDDISRCGADHQSRLATRSDHPQPQGLCACLGKRRPKCLQRHAALRTSDSAAVRQEIQRALGPASALVGANRAAARAQLQRATSRQGLSRLTQIATLVLIATVLAMSVAMGTMIWQRRPRLARMKVQGYRAWRVVAGAALRELPAARHRLL